MWAILTNGTKNVTIVTNFSDTVNFIFCAVNMQIESKILMCGMNANGHLYVVGWDFQ